MEDEPEGADLADDGGRPGVGLDDVDLRRRDTPGAAQLHRRPAAEDARAGALGDGRGIEGVIEVRVAEDDGVRPRDVAREQAVVREERTHHAAQERGAREVRVEEHRVSLARELEAGGPEPAHPDACKCGSEGVRSEGEVVRVHLAGSLYRARR